MDFSNYNWMENLSIGNPDIDYDHKKVLEIINDLVDLIENKRSRVEFARILSKMTDYSLTHFKHEENYMLDLGFPQLNAHRKHHLNYVYKVSMYNHNSAGNNPPDPSEVVSFLKNWWENHILKEDSLYEIYRKESNAQAKYIKLTYS
jgi:hemerythrin-like metal-binding protein